MVWSVTFFFLTALGIVAMFFLADRSWFTPIACIVIAELLIRRFKFERTGVESALWLGGLFTAIAALPGEGKPEAILLFAAASAIAGWRVRNPYIGALTAIFVIAYFAEKHWYVVALLAGIAIAAAALVARARDWQRPSTDALFAVVLIVSPIAGAVVSTDETWLLWGFTYLTLAVAELAFAERKRDRISLVAAAISIAIAAIMLREAFTFALEWKLIASGALLFAIATFVARRLSGKTRGFVMTPVKSAYEEALRIFGTAAFAPHTAQQPVQQPVGAGGKFGGAGATGDY